MKVTWTDYGEFPLNINGFTCQLWKTHLSLLVYHRMTHQGTSILQPTCKASFVLDSESDFLSLTHWTEITPNLQSQTYCLSTSTKWNCNFAKKQEGFLFFAGMCRLPSSVCLGSSIRNLHEHSSLYFNWSWRTVPLACKLDIIWELCPWVRFSIMNNVDGPILLQMHDSVMTSNWSNLSLRKIYLFLL